MLSPSFPTPSLSSSYSLTSFPSLLLPPFIPHLFSILILHYNILPFERRLIQIQNQSPCVYPYLPHSPPPPHSFLISFPSLIPPTPQSRQSARLSLQSSDLAPPPPHPQASVAPPPLVPGGGTHQLGGEGAGGANSDEGTRDRHSGIL